jgi:hypothetical protein
MGKFIVPSTIGFKSDGANLMYFGVCLPNLQVDCNAPLCQLNCPLSKVFLNLVDQAPCPPCVPDPRHVVLSTRLCHTAFLTSSITN